MVILEKCEAPFTSYVHCTQMMRSGMLFWRLVTNLGDCIAQMHPSLRCVPKIPPHLLCVVRSPLRNQLRYSAWCIFGSAVKAALVGVITVYKPVRIVERAPLPSRTTCTPPPNMTLPVSVFFILWLHTSWITKKSSWFSWTSAVQNLQFKLEAFLFNKSLPQEGRTRRSCTCTCTIRVIDLVEFRFWPSLVHR